MRGEAKSESSICINLSRIGARGGLREFSEALVRCMRANYRHVEIVAPEFKRGEWGDCARYVPNALASGSRVSKLRPILWWIYAAAAFPARRGAAVLSTTHHVLPWRSGQVVTVHDLRPYFLPDSFMQAFYFKVVLPRALKRCDGILTVSEATKKDLIETYRVPSDNIFVVPNCVDLTRFAPDKKCDSDPYLLMVGCSWKHKNLQEVLANSDGWRGNYRLKVVAENSQHILRMKELVEHNNLGSRVEFLENVESQTLTELYKNCAALLYPSKMEGFGIPPLEAMACGRPVIVSDIPVFREIYGSVPIYVTLGERSSWEAAWNALRDEPLVNGKILEGVRVAATYSTTRMCSALLKALKEIWKIDPDETPIHSDSPDDCLSSAVH